MSTTRRFSNPSVLTPQRVKVKLVRDGFDQPWGFRLSGGKDIGMPLTIQRAQAGTPSEGELRPGDVVHKIGEHDARNLSHKDAQHLFRNAGNTIDLIVQRGGPASPKPAAASAPMSPPLPPVSAAASPMAKAPCAGGVATPFAAAAAAQRLTTALPSHPAPVAPAHTVPLQVQTAPPALSSSALHSPVLPNNDHFSKTLLSPVQHLPVTVFPPPLPGFTPAAGQPRRPLTPTPFAMHDIESPESIDQQPYRTTPLVLPGAKTKREVPITSYLRHHPNPAVRAAPHHFDGQVDVLMKQKVVHQFNSPIGLYSEQNITEAVQQTTGVTPYKGKKTLYYDPAKSETFKALKDSELGDTVTEVPTPIQPKVFTPQKHIQPPLHQMQRPSQAPKSPQPTNNNNHIFPSAEEKIHQSYSFRRLMNEVLGESEF